MSTYPVSPPEWDSFWLQPNGVLRLVGYGGHHRAARVFVPDNDIDPERDLERMGWVHISIGHRSVGIYTDKTPSNTQLAVLFDILRLAPNPVLRDRFIEAVRDYVPDFMMGET